MGCTHTLISPKFTILFVCACDISELFCFGCNEARQRWHAAFTSWEVRACCKYVAACQRPWLMFTVGSRSCLLLLPACSKLGNGDVWWAPSGVLGPWLMFTVGSQSCLLLLVVSSATMTCGGLRQVSLLCKWVA